MAVPVLGDRMGDSSNWARWNPDGASTAEEGALDRTINGLLWTRLPLPKIPLSEAHMDSL